MVMKRIRAGSGKGMQIITSSSRHRAKNVDRASRALENDFGYVGRPAAPPDPFQGAPDMRPQGNAVDAAKTAMTNLGTGIMQTLGLNKGRVSGDLGDGFAPGGKRVVPKSPKGPARMLKGFGGDGK